MKHPTPDYPLLALSEALQSLTGAGTAMLLTCSVGGAIPAAAEYSDLPRSDEWFSLAFAWVAHWAIAGIMVWGVFAAIVPAWCFYELLHGANSVSLVLAVAFGMQLIVSTVAMFAMEGGPGWQRVAVGVTERVWFDGALGSVANDAPPIWMVRPPRSLIRPNGVSPSITERFMVRAIS